MKRSVLLFLFVALSSISLFAQSVAIGSGSLTPHSSAILDLQSNEKGFLAPRISNPTSITSPATGLLVYNTTTNEFNVFDGTSWQSISGATYSAGTGISISGNVINSVWSTNSTNIFNNNLNNVGIGTNDPKAKLGIMGGIALGNNAGGDAINTTWGGRNSIQFVSTDGEACTNHTAALMYSTMPCAWGAATLNVAISNNWGSYNTTNLAMKIGQDLTLFNNNVQANGSVYWGTQTRRTETLTNASAKDSRSGFYESGGGGASNYPLGSDWHHLMQTVHANFANATNHYSMQLASNYWNTNQSLFFRKTGPNWENSWLEVATVGRGNGGMISYQKNEYYGVAGPNVWHYVTGYSPWISIRNGDQIKLEGMYYGRLTGGSNNEYFYTQVEITGQNGCAALQYANQHDYWHPTEASADHDNFKPVPYLDVWSSNCTGDIRFRLMIYVGGDDNWESRENIIIGTRY